MTLPTKKRKDTADNARPMFYDKTAEERYKRHKHLTYGRLILQGLVYCVLGLLVSHALKLL